MVSPATPNPTGRFSDRVEDYVRWRPGYPVELVRVLERERDISPALTRVLDLGCGTGISSALFVSEGYSVTGVEPNAEMRRMAEATLGASSLFQLVDGRAESVPLPDSSVELVVVAQAFHWFERAAFRLEAQRLLVDNGTLALVWNGRRTDSSAFLRAYEELLRRHARDYARVNHKRITESELLAFFGPQGCERLEFSTHQDFDLEGLRGRALSSSYVPRAGEAGHAEMMAGLGNAFEIHARSGTVRFEYDTTLHFGGLS